MAEKLNVTVALVTVTSSGIRRATAIKLAAYGTRVALIARNGDELSKTADLIEAAGCEVLVIRVDITTWNSASWAALS